MRTYSGPPADFHAAIMGQRQACEKGRRWATLLPAGFRANALSAMLAVAVRRSALAGLSRQPGSSRGAPGRVVRLWQEADEASPPARSPAPHGTPRARGGAGACAPRTALRAGNGPGRDTGGEVTSVLDYAGRSKALEETLRAGIAEYGDARAFAAVSRALANWSEADLEGTLMVTAWRLAAERAPACPPGPEDGVPLDHTARFEYAVADFGAYLDDLIAAMGGPPAGRRTAVTGQRQACEKGRRWAASRLSPELRANMLSATLAVAVRRSALAGPRKLPGRTSAPEPGT